MNLLQELDQHVQQAFEKCGLVNEDAMIQPTMKVDFGDYQINGIMGIAKKQKINPRELAQKVVEQLQLDGIANKVEIAGPGFINLHLDPAYVAERATQALFAPDLAVTKPEPQTIVVDYSSPNLAKEMHVGHLRSTIIGDALNRVFTFLGHKVVAQNHVGDWGTQFGMLTAYLLELEESGNLDLLLSDLEEFYRMAKIKFDQDEEFAAKARDYVVRLQGGDEQILELWQRFVNVSLQHCQSVYTKLNVLLTPKDVRGESAYNDDLQNVVDELLAKKIAVNDDGANVVFIEEIRAKDDKPTPFIVQKKDGAFLYSTTDLACIKYRAKQLKADRIVYVVDARQGLHFQELFLTANKASFAPENIQLEHVAFGTMMGADNRPFKTRDGGTVKLASLLDEAIERAQAVVADKNPNLSAEEMAKIANAVGISAVKYADLSKSRTSDYVFNWEQMLSFEGNTAPYLQYAYTRINSVLNKAGEFNADEQVATQESIEKQLAILLLQFENVLYHAANSSYLHLLANYLYNIATLFSRFYEACPILKAEGHVRDQRLQLARLTAATLKQGMDLLGLEVLDVM